jgi:tetratricopeptide (TPR) repeat protein
MRAVEAMNWRHSRGAAGATQSKRHNECTAFVAALAALLLVIAPIGAQSPAESALARGVAALHAFEYEDANELFQEARRLDPGLPLAYWGEAMTWHQTLWGHENLGEGRQALARLGATADAGRSRAHSSRDQGLLDAIERLFGEGDAETRRREYADAMRRLYAQQPQDPEVASFYALALLGTMSRGLIGTGDAHEGHSQALAGSDTQRRVGEILVAVLRTHPQHPGALHYLLHNYDDPAHAAAALAAARTLARLAPDSSHTRHMPAHIFLQLGRWDEAARADRAAVAASDAWIARKHLAPAMRNFHALAWLQYELLQLGRYREARAAIGELEPLVKASGDLTLLTDLSSMRARYVIETANWALMANESNFGNVHELFAIGASAARSGNRPLAERAQQALGERANDPREGDLRPAIAIMEREVAALLALAAGRRDEAIATLQAAADAEARMPAPLGLPAPPKPASELLGEVLIETGRPAQAIAAFQATLERNRNRSLSVLGLARATAAAGQRVASVRHYRALLVNFAAADAGLPVVREARAAVDGAQTKQR